ncbi:MAG: fatty acid desaturase [Nocardioidaceae bacterium]|nr:fatty acid desaturase [Nocardioidaceae bacterium]
MTAIDNQAEPNPMRATMGADHQAWPERLALGLFIAVPFVAFAAAIPIAWGGWLGWSDVAITFVMYGLTLHGVTVGYHRLFTHRSFKPNRAVEIAVGMFGWMASEGPVIPWGADHRKHHKFSDKDGDPHSPWRYGNSMRGLIKGFVWAHVGWLFDPEQTSIDKYAPDLVKDRDLLRISRTFWVWVLTSLFLPALLGFLLTWSWQGAVTAFFWGTIVRVGLIHHVTWSINSICHTLGERPFASRDFSGNVWWLAIPSGGESWHNLHHADPTSARHGVKRFQFDTSARIIWLLEKCGWVHDVRWPTEARIKAKSVTPAA